MLFLDNRGHTDPHLNLALEEYAVRHLDPGASFLLLYRNAPSVIVGRNQNPFEEIDPEYVASHRIPVLRRISGGGAVYHDAGNLNFSFIVPHPVRRPRALAEFAEPVVEALRELGVPAELAERNNIRVSGRKVSGHAQFRTVNRLFSHGTLLFDSDLAAVTASLDASGRRITSKAPASIRSPVTNVRPHLRSDLTAAAFRNVIARRLCPGFEEKSRRELTEEEWQRVRELAASKYRRWEWTYGESPAFTISSRVASDAGEVHASIDVAGGRVASVTFDGANPPRGIERLAGVRFARDALERALAGLVEESDSSGWTQERLLALLWGR